MLEKPSAKPRGRPPKEIPRIDASPEYVARAIFSAVKRPDPSVRRAKDSQPEETAG